MLTRRALLGLASLMTLSAPINLSRVADVYVCGRRPIPENNTRRIEYGPIHQIAGVSPAVLNLGNCQTDSWTIHVYVSVLISSAVIIGIR